MVEERIKELKPHHPVFAAILEKVHKMNLKEVIQRVSRDRRPKNAIKDPASDFVEINLT